MHETYILGFKNSLNELIFPVILALILKKAKFYTGN